MKITVHILPFNKTISSEENTLLIDVIQKAGIPIRFDCNRLGLCGKCRVKIIEGNTPPLQPQEEYLLEDGASKHGFRLACLLPIQSPLTVEIPEESLLRDLVILKTGLEREVQLDPAVKKFCFQLPQPTLSEPTSFFELIQNGLKNPRLTVNPSTLNSASAAQETKKSRISVAIHKDREILSIEEGNTVNRNFGLAIDLGTTTLVLDLIDLNTGDTIDSLAQENTQTQYGSDVISRIGFSIADPENIHTLQKNITDTLNRMIGKILKNNRLDSQSVYEIVLAGNTTMNHALLGFPLQSLSRAPFQALFGSLSEFDASSLGLRIHPRGKLYIAPNIRSFVGGDISAGLIASGLAERKGNHLFIDLGTNGEIVLKTQREIIATSTAAGPAFEGRNISCGMLALPGAIDRIEKGTAFVCSTIGNRPPKGICGTGLIDAVALLLDEGKVTGKGKIRDKSDRIAITDRIYITQKDIREIQLAVAAIKSGRNMMLKKYSLDPGRLDGVFIAGAFGNFLNIGNSIRIGLLPPLPEEKIHFIGNSSLAGAKALLIAASLREEVEALNKKIRYFSLASDTFFQDYFVGSLDFPP